MKNKSEKMSNKKEIPISYWNDIQLDKKLFGDPVENNWGYSYTFITLPDNDTYDEGYGFSISSKLVGTSTFSLPNDYKIELQKAPALRQPRKRYKRYKMTGLELKETVLKNYIVDLRAEAAERLEKEKADRDRRNKKIIGRIVYGRYVGNHYGQSMELYSDYFFDHKGSFSNSRHDKVRNVRVELVIIDNVSKYCYQKSIDMISAKLKDWHRLNNAIEELQKLNNPDDCVQPIICQLEENKKSIMNNLRKDILKNEK